jgi:hypothetical protein
MDLRPPYPYGPHSLRSTHPERPSEARIPDVVLALDLPRQQYKTVKTVLVPFDPRVSHGAKFATLHEALVFVSKHCLVHHKSFNKNLAKMYLPYCRILNFLKGGYTLLTNVSKRDFELEFNAVARALPPGR